MGMSEMAVALWNGHLSHNPQDPKWANRDRFVLSNGHGSMLLYSLLHCRFVWVLLWVQAHLFFPALLPE